VAITDKSSYALGWIIQQTPNGSIVWHNGGTFGFGAFVGLLVDKDVGVIILTNEENNGLPDSIGSWALDRLLANPRVDYAADTLKAAKTSFETTAKLIAKPANPRPFPALAPLAGNFANPSFGVAVVAQDGNALVMELQATGAKLRLEPWDGDIFIARLMPIGPFGPIVEGAMRKGFVQFQMDKDGKLNLLRLSSEQEASTQAYEFRRE
jgi:hypothetical protein